MILTKSSSARRRSCGRAPRAARACGWLLAGAALLAAGGDEGRPGNGEWVRRGNEARQAGRTDEAIAAYGKAIEVEPGQYEARILLADTLRRAGRAAEAAVQYAGAVAIDPARPEGHAGLALIKRAAYDYEGAAAIIRDALPRADRERRPDLLLNLGETRRKQGRPAEALDLVTQVAAARPAEAQAQASLARLAEERGDLAGALRFWDRYLELRPDDQAAELRRADLRRIQGSIDLLREAAARAPGTGVAAEIGRLLSVSGDAAGAAAAYREALGVEPGSVVARRGLALALRDAGDGAGAAAEFRRLLKSRPRDGVALYNLVALARASGDAAAEDKAWKDLLAARPDDLFAQRGYAGFLDRSGDEAMQRALESPPARAADGRGARLRALILAAAGRFPEAAAAAYDSLRADPNDPWTLEVVNDLLFPRPDLLRVMGERAQKEAARGGAAGAADDPAALLLLARFTSLAGHANEALGLARRAVAAAPGSSFAHAALAEYVQAAARDAPLALEEMRRAIASDPGRLAPHVDYALALLRAGRVGEAEAAAREGLERLPGAAPLLALVGAARADAEDFEGAAAAYAASLREDPADNLGLARAQLPLALAAAGRPIEARRALRGDLPPLPDLLYREAWTFVRDACRDRSFGGQDWSSWRDRYRGQLATPQDAYRAIAAMLASLGDPYTRLRDPEETAAVYLARRGRPASADRLGRNRPEGQTVIARDLPGGLGYIKLSNLTDPKAVAEVRAALEAMKDKEKIVLDLRGNTGGLARSADAIGDLIAGPGKEAGVDVGPEGAAPRVTGGDGAVTTSPVVVLVDGQTGSAAERLARTLEATGRGTLMGETTHGKGLAQSSRVLEGGMTVLVSSIETMGPDGRRIEGRGLKPGVPTRRGDDADTPEPARP